MDSMKIMGGGDNIFPVLSSDAETNLSVKESHQINNK